MKRSYLQIVVGIYAILGIFALSGAQVNPILSNSNVVATPTPVKLQQKPPCVMPSFTPQPNVLQSKPVEGANIRSITDTMKHIDRDCDGISDYDDNCIDVYNPKQTDQNKNEIGDACEPNERAESPLNKHIKLRQKQGCIIPTSTATVKTTRLNTKPEH